jgi:hypothetical protein
VYILNVPGSEQASAHSDKWNSENTEAESDVCAKMKDEVGVTKDTVDFKVIYNKNKYDVNFLLDNTIRQLKQHLQDIIGTAARPHSNATAVPEVSPYPPFFSLLLHNLSY